MQPCLKLLNVNLNFRKIISIAFQYILDVTMLCITVLNDITQKFVIFYQFYILITEDNTLFICRLNSKKNPKHSVFSGLN